MSLHVLPSPAVDPTEADPFFYGWRYVQQVAPDGSTTIEQVPLTLEDVLHPEEEDFIVQTDLHSRMCHYFADVLRARVEHDPHAFVSCDLRIAWDVRGVRPMGPDVAVFFGERERVHWSTFDVAEEGPRPALVIEVLSPSTEAVDFDRKRTLYARAGVPLYLIADIPRPGGPPEARLLGYQLTDGGEYASLVPDERGWLWVEPVGFWMAAEGDWVVLRDAAGKLMGDYTAVSAALAQAETRAEAEAEARSAAEARAADLEARLRTVEAELRRLRDA